MTREEIQNRAEEWISLDKNTETSNEIKKLLDDENFDALEQCLFTRMEFGTAGLRAAMGAGYSKMNDLTIIQTTQGFLRYLQEKFPDDLMTRGLVIGYDARHNSSRFARLIVAVFLSANVKCHFYTKIVPTPFVPYAVTKYNACAGIMVTASHNPKDDNGYKVYWDNGSQIIPPHDSGIAASILSNLQPWGDEVWDTNKCENTDLCHDPYDEVMTSYFEDVKTYNHFPEINATSPINFTYTPVHGVGLKFAQKSFETFGFKPFTPTPEQMHPDPDFTTVKYPNPEEGKGVLLLAIQAAEASNSSIILANDPDADRLAVAEKQPDGTWKVFSGNQLGALFGWWAWECYVRTTSYTHFKDVFMLSSTVSSMILQSMANVEGFSFEDTLTGFKWMGNRADELTKDGMKVLYAFEEAIGYMYGCNVRDKDGISACSVIAEAACWLHTKRLTLTQQLENIYQKYGFHFSNNSYYLCYDQSKLVAMFERLRNYDGVKVIKDKKTGHKYPGQLDCYKIKNVRDLTTGFDSRNKDGKAKFSVGPSSQMMTFYFENGCILTIRTSGTEPKIKYYSEMIGPVGSTRSREDLIAELNDLIEKMCQEFYQPDKNGFLSKPE